MRDNASKTGNLQTILKLKVGAPVVLTSNHPKRKYKEESEAGQTLETQTEK